MVWNLQYAKALTCDKNSLGHKNYLRANNLVGNMLLGNLTSGPLLIKPQAILIKIFLKYLFLSLTIVIWYILELMVLIKLIDFQIEQSYYQLLK